MKLKTSFNIFTFLIAIIQVTSVHNQTIGCNYTIDASKYTCKLIINNPNGLNNFQFIDGIHLAGYTMYHVERLVKGDPSISKNFPSIICEKMRNINFIDVNNMKIERIDEYSFKGCKNLVKLYLQENKISVGGIHEKAFNENLKLELIYLQNNQLKFYNLPGNVFKPLRNLGRLALSFNMISILNPQWFLTLENLKYLHIDDNQFAEIPENTFSPLVNLTELWMFKNMFKVIHSKQFSIHPKLYKIMVQLNQIEAIDEKFIDNVGVTRFELSNNVCANKDINDGSTGRLTMKNELSHCFRNYHDLYPECFTGNTDERVCKLEDEMKVLKSQIDKQTQLNPWNDMIQIGSFIDNTSNNNSTLEEFLREVYKLKSEKEVMQEQIEKLHTENIKLADLISELMAKGFKN